MASRQRTPSQQHQAQQPPVYAPRPPLRWARASKARGDFCRDDSHYGHEYLYGEPPPGGTVPVELWACGRCWKPETNPAALREQEVRYG